MKNRFAFATLVALFVSVCMSFSAEAKKDKVFETKQFTPGEFEFIECSIPGELIYTHGECGVKIYARSEAFEKITCYVSGGKVIIKSKVRNFADVDDIKIYVSSRVLAGVELNGAVKMEAEQGISGVTFDAQINGAGDMEIEGFNYKTVTIKLNGASELDIEGAKCGSIKLTCNGSSDCEIKGTADSADLTINGVGKIDIKELACDKVVSAVNGIGKISRK